VAAAHPYLALEEAGEHHQLALAVEVEHHLKAWAVAEEEMEVGLLLAVDLLVLILYLQLRTVGEEDPWCRTGWKLSDEHSLRLDLLHLMNHHLYQSRQQTIHLPQGELVMAGCLLVDFELDLLPLRYLGPVGGGMGCLRRRIALKVMRLELLIVQALGRDSWFPYPTEGW